jgi:hypothetical protein
MTTIPETSVATSQRLPWPAMAAALVSFAALYFVDVRGRFVGLPILAAVLIATYFTPRRLPSSAAVGWVLRVAIFSFLVFVAGPTRFVHGSIFGGSVLYEPQYTNLFGYLCAAELVLRAWLRRRGGPSRGEMMFLSALVFMAATNTYERRVIRVLAPLYVAFIALSLRLFHPRAKSSDDQKPRRLRGALVPRFAALFIALVVGFVSSTVVNSYGDDITRWYVSLVMRQHRSEKIGLSTTPQLTAMFNPTPTMERVMTARGTLPDPHLRAMAFDTYARGAWRPGLTGATFAHVEPHDLDLDAPGPRLHINRMPDELNLLYVPLHAAGVVADQAPLERDTFGALHVAGDEHVTDEYDVILSGDRDHQGPVAMPLDERQRLASLVLPEGLAPQVREIAKSVAGKLVPRDRPAAVEKYLQANHNTA